MTLRVRGGRIVAVICTLKGQDGKPVRTVCRNWDSYQEMLLRSEGEEGWWSSLVTTGNAKKEVEIPVAFKGAFFGCTAVLDGLNRWRCIR